MSDCKIPELLTPREVAAIRRTTVAHLANERSRGGGPPFAKLGGKIVYPADRLREYITERTVTPTRQAG
jgi:hypothetical protein